ncbi:MAG: dihydrolipoyl dehydrogenase [Anaerolineales bacterium]|nr:dihydrolipoyl dehydrogenase [Anaerolineales bacterium]
MSNYDVLVIGAGPAGYVAAIRAAQLGQTVGIIEKEFLGGVCLNIGCVPSKSLLRNAEVAHTLRERGKEFGFSFDNLTLDYGVALKRSRQVSDRLTKGVGFLMKKNKIEVHMGTAKFTASNTLEVTDADGSTQTHTARNIIVATGAHPFVIPGIEVDGKQVVTYIEAILQDTLPKSVVIIGAGAIGMEFATIWHSYGVDVTIVEMLDRLVPNEDPEISKEIKKAFDKKKITTITGGKVTGVEKLKTKVKVNVETAAGSQMLEAEQVLMAASFLPNSKGLGLEEIGVKVSERGFIEIDDRMATNVPGVWAIGDVTGKLMLAHVGMAQGIVCAENIAGEPTIALNYQSMPKATYCQPQIASFGMTEDQAKEAGYEVKVGRFNFQANGKALGLGDYAGFAKLITDAKYGEILGAHLIGPEVTELLPELTLAQLMEITPAEIARNVHAHPTLSEVLLEIAEDAIGHAIHQ